MSDPRVPPEERIGEPEGVDPALSPDHDDDPVRKQEEEEAQKLLDGDDSNIDKVEP